MKTSLYVMIMAIFSMGYAYSSTAIEAPEMTPEQIRAYMSSYDQTYDNEHERMKNEVVEGLLTGLVRLDQERFCYQFDERKEVKLLSLEQSDPQYHAQLGAIDGEYDAKKVGCLEGYAFMKQQVEYYAQNIRPRWKEGIELGQKVAAIKLEIFDARVSTLERSCLNSPKVLGIVRIFLQDEQKADDRLSAIQADCQGQARQIVAIHQEILEREQSNQLLANEGEEAPSMRVFSPRVDRVPAAGGAGR